MDINDDNIKVNFYCKVMKKEDKLFLYYPFMKFNNEGISLDNDDYISISPEIHLFLMTSLDLMNREPELVYYVNDINVKEVTKISKLNKIDKVTPENELDIFEKQKRHYLSKIMDFFAGSFSISNVTLFDFFKMDRKLVSKGYTISDENREEKYLDIINTGDSDLIELLSSYLDSYDDMNKIDAKYSEYKYFATKIECASTLKEVEDVYKDFIGMF